MDSLNWFEELLSKTNGSEFDIKKIPDMFDVIVHEGDKVYAEWDITKELLENGMSRKHFSDADLNVDIELLFVHKDLKKELLIDESFKLFWEKAANDSNTFDFNGTTSGYTMMEERQKIGQYIYYTEGAITLLIGLVGVILKMRASSQKGVVKVVRVSASIWCIIIGALTIVPEYNRYFSLQPQFSVKLLLIVISSLVTLLIKVFMMSMKIFTAIIYAFQNIMLYRPFYFREHRKSFSRWLLRMSLGQIVAMLVTFIGWSMILLFKFEESCNGIEARAASWQIALTSLAIVGYVGSLFLSISFLIGYWKNNNKDVRKSQIKNFKKTMISCSIEILFDLIILAVNGALPINCFSFDFEVFGIEQVHTRTKCDLYIRFMALDVGLSKCGVAILILQPTIQELFFLISELVDHCTKA